MCTRATRRRTKALPSSAQAPGGSRRGPPPPPRPRLAAPLEGTNRQGRPCLPPRPRLLSGRLCAPRTPAVLTQGEEKRSGCPFCLCARPCRPLFSPSAPLLPPAAGQRQPAPLGASLHRTRRRPRAPPPPRRPRRSRRPPPHRHHHHPRPRPRPSAGRRPAKLVWSSHSRWCHWRPTVMRRYWNCGSATTLRRAEASALSAGPTPWRSVATTSDVREACTSAQARGAQGAQQGVEEAPAQRVHEVVQGGVVQQRGGRGHPRVEAREQRAGEGFAAWSAYQLATRRFSARKAPTQGPRIRARRCCLRLWQRTQRGPRLWRRGGARRWHPRRPPRPPRHLHLIGREQVDVRAPTLAPSPPRPTGTPS